MLAASAILLLSLLGGRLARADEVILNRPAVPGALRLETRTRHLRSPQIREFVAVASQVRWEVAETAIIVCDMWAEHYCDMSANRIDEMAPRMNSVLTAARDHGVMIIHAPGGGVHHYAGTPFRRRMQQAKHHEPPVPIQSWVWHDRRQEVQLPIDDTSGGVDDPEPGERHEFDRRQHPAIRIVGYDGISDDGQEIYNFCRQEGITNIVLMGVHTNMCVLSRSFGIRQMRRLGMNVVLCRDLTDAMYDPRDYPYVSHAQGTELVVEHIETYWCPSIRSVDLTRVLPGSARPDNRRVPNAALTRSTHTPGGN